jgi:hypothetical protein
MYNHADNYLWFCVIDNLGRQAKPDAAPNIEIYKPGGDTLVSSTAMTAYAGTDTGFLAYDAQTAEFTIGATATDGTSGATGLIVGQAKTGATGVLELVDINGTFANNNAITDDGENTGTAVINGTLFQADYYYDVDTTTTANYPNAKNYGAKVEYAIGTRNYEHKLYFDISFYPAVAPWVTSQDVAQRYPVLLNQIPEEWPDWSPAVQAAHADLVRKIHALGEAAAYFLKRGEEMWGIEMAYVRAEIARAIGEDQEKIDYWEERAAKAWAARGEFTYDSSQDDSEIDEDVRVISSGFTR